MVDSPIDRRKHPNGQHEEQYVFESSLIHWLSMYAVSVVPDFQGFWYAVHSRVRQRADTWIAEDLSYGHYGEATAKLGDSCEKH